MPILEKLTSHWVTLSLCFMGDNYCGFIFASRRLPQLRPIWLTSLCRFWSCWRRWWVHFSLGYDEVMEQAAKLTWLKWRTAIHGWLATTSEDVKEEHDHS